MLMNTEIERTVRFVKEQLEGAEAGHDWFHVEDRKSVV